MENLKDLALVDYSLMIKGGRYLLTTPLKPIFTELIAKKKLKIETNYELICTEELKYMPLSYKAQLTNGFLVETVLQAHRTLQVTLTYIPEENLLYQSPIENILPSHSIYDANNRNALNFFQRATGKVLTITTTKLLCPRGRNNFSQVDATGTIPGLDGTILIFSQRNVIYILKKLGSNAVKLLCFSDIYSTINMPRPKKTIESQVKKFKSTALLKGSYNEVAFLHISCTLMFAVILGLLAKFVNRQLASRRRRLRRRRPDTALKIPS